ncbi:MAG: tetratricopeptide repeat protein, partial [Planctomycetes bacterium]|nr:tetratricopeptide repeat protein [Planctomycetota bacterium]
MSTKTLLITSVLFVFLLSVAAGVCFADASAQLEQADTYKDNKDYEQAEAIYRDIVTNYPGTDEAFQAQKNLALLYIITARYSAGRQEVDTLITNFADHPELPDEIYKFAGQYWNWGKRYEDARWLYEYIAENHSDSDLAIKARTWAAGADILLGNDARAQSGIDALIRDFAGHPELAGMLWELGDGNWKFGKYDWSRQIYQHIFEIDPQDPLAMQAKARVAESDMRMGNYAAAQAGIDSLIVDFADHPELPDEIYKFAGQYWNWGKRYE